MSTCAMHHDLLTFDPPAPSFAAPSMEGVEMLCVMDLVLFVAESVYKTSSLQLTALMMAKLLAQDTVEALAYR